MWRAALVRPSLSSPLARMNLNNYRLLQHQQTICRVDEELFCTYNNHPLASDNNIHNLVFPFFTLPEVSLSLPASVNYTFRLRPHITACCYPSGACRKAWRRIIGARIENYKQKKPILSLSFLPKNKSAFFY